MPRSARVWYWEIYDQRRGRVRSNSWIDDATGDSSKGEALAAELKRARALEWSAGGQAERHIAPRRALRGSSDARALRTTAA